MGEDRGDPVDGAWGAQQPLSHTAPWKGAAGSRHEPFRALPEAIEGAAVSPGAPEPVELTC